MAHKITGKLRGLAAALVAVFAALALVPAAATAATWSGTGSIVVNGAGIDPDGVHVYQVATITLGDDNVTDFTPVPELEDEVNAWVADNSAQNAADIADAATGLDDLTDSTALVTAKTDPAGVTISKLDAGLYLIKIDTNGTTVYQNIVVALEPTPVAGTQDWTLGTATVDVKSTSSTLEKTATSTSGDDHIYTDGDVVNYTVKFAVGADMDEFYLDDTMTGATFNDGVTITVPGEPVATLTPGTDYNVYTTQTAYEDAYPDGPAWKDGIDFRVVFTAAGIKAAGGHDDVTMTYSGTVDLDEATVTDGIDNKITSNINETGDNGDVALAGIKVYKHGDANLEEDGVQDGPLAGAVFGLYTTDPTNNDEAEPIKSATTGADGYATFTTLLDPTQTYYVKEISAPSGYKPVGTVYTVSPAGTEGADYALVANGYEDLSVENEPSGTGEGIGLPTTGGMGTIAFTAAGVVIIAGAAAFIVRSRKNNA